MIDPESPVAAYELKIQRQEVESEKRTNQYDNTSHMVLGKVGVRMESFSWCSPSYVRILF
jgi:hypothetical protein